MYYTPKPKTKKDALSAERDIYSSFSKKTFVPSNMSLSSLKEKSNIVVESTKTSAGYIFHIKGKPKKGGFIHPVIMGRRR